MGELNLLSWSLFPIALTVGNFLPHWVWIQYLIKASFFWKHELEARENGLIWISPKKEQYSPILQDKLVLD